jgi:glycosyltransferase involved in cell wall biosynthesis
MTEQIEFSIIIPALNEEQNIELAILNSLNAIEHFNINGELIVINDGSNDKTEQLVKSYMERDHRVRLISHDRPMGIGASFWDGVDQARGKFVVMLPGDNEIDLMETFRYYPLLNSVDIVIPFVFNKHIRSAYRNALSWIYRFIINATFLVNFNYTNGTVMYRKAILDELEFRSSSFFFQTDILVRTVKRDYLFAEVPYRMGLRTQGISKAITFPSLFQVIRGYLRLVRDIYGPTPNNAPKSHVASSLTAKRYQECEDLERSNYKLKP